ncbi:MAG: leukotoxin LktA family filamentous adhesin, partial [Candidatus Omnitrophica bacterium]|nr:leukotoxin LktA family filamentous adhesin [Candidatus Omnitrophota bacterium]
MLLNKKLRRVVSSFVLVCFLINQSGFSQQIVVDNKTRTTVTVSGNVTDVRTGTIRGSNAFNSFSSFDVYKNNVVNLHLPDSTPNLINLVHDKISNINGILNSIKNGSIGGNVFMLNPYGVMVGKDGVVNVGSITAMTPTKNFMDNFFDSSGIPSDISTMAVIDGAVPINTNGLIYIDGQINAIKDVNLSAGGIKNSGLIQSGANFQGNAPDFSDIVNINTLDNANRIIVENGNIEIVAVGDFDNSGAIVADGGENLDGGNITISVGNNISLSGDSLIASRGRGVKSGGGVISVWGDNNAVISENALIAAGVTGLGSGDGGAIEFSSGNHMSINGGGFDITSFNGKSGSVLLDPITLDITTNQFLGAGDWTFDALARISLFDGVTVSSRVVDGAGDSTANSGTLTFTAPEINLGLNSKVLAHANKGFISGDVTFNATSGSFLVDFIADTGINANKAEITGNNVYFYNEVTADMGLFYSGIDAAVNLIDTKVIADNNIDILAKAVQLDPKIDTGIDVIATDASVLITNSVLSAGNDIKIQSLADAKLTIDGFLPDTLADLAVVVGDITSNTKINGTSQLNANNDISIAAVAKTDVAALAKAQATTPASGVLAVSDIRTQAFAELSGATQLDAGNNVSLSAKNTTKSITMADGLMLKATSGVGLAVAVGVVDADSSAQMIDQAKVIDANNVDIKAQLKTDVETLARSVMTGEPAKKADEAIQDSSNINDRAKQKSQGAFSRGGSQFAAGIAVTVLDSDNVAAINTEHGAADAAVNATGDLTVNATALNNVSNLAQGTNAEAADNSLSAAVSIMVANANNNAYIGKVGGVPLKINARSVSVLADSYDFDPIDPSAIDDINDYNVLAYHGQGANNVGIAGSVAVGVLVNESSAYISENTQLTLTDNLEIVAKNKTQASTIATGSPNSSKGAKLSKKLKSKYNAANNQTPSSTTSPVGIGAAFSVGVFVNTVKAFIAKYAKVFSVNNAKVESVGLHEGTVTAAAGVKPPADPSKPKPPASGGISLNGAVSVAVGASVVESYIGKGEQLVTNGDVTVTTKHKNEVATIARSDSASGTASVGLSAAVTVTDDWTTSRIERDILSGGSVNVLSQLDKTSIAQAKASAGGAVQPEPDPNDPDAEQPSIIDEAWTIADDNAVESPKPKKGNAKPKTGKLPISVGVAGAVAINVANSEVESVIRRSEDDTGTIDIVATDNVKVEALSNIAAGSAANASVVNSSIGIGLGVAVNTAFQNTNAILAENTTIFAGKLVTVEAGMLEVDYMDTVDVWDPVEEKMVPTQVQKTDDEHNFVAIAVSGAGAKSVGIAGSIAVNIVDNEHKATIETDTVTSGEKLGAESINNSDTDTYAGAKTTIKTAKKGKKVSNKATTDNQVNGLEEQQPTTPSGGGSSSPAVKIGIGAAVAIGVNVNTSKAYIADGTIVTKAGSVDISAIGKHSSMV